VKNTFFTKNEKNLHTNISRGPLTGGPRQVPRLPPLKHTTGREVTNFASQKFRLTPDLDSKSLEQEQSRNLKKWLRPPRWLSKKGSSC